MAALTAVGLLWQTATAAAQQAPVVQNDPSAASEKADRGVRIVVREVNIRSVSALDTIHGQIQLRVTVTNDRTTPVSVQASQFSLMVDSTATIFNPAVTEPLVAGRHEIAPKSSLTGNLAFHVQHNTSEQPTLTLKWTDGEATTVVDVTEAIRRLPGVATTLMGPGNCLAVVELHRPLDHVAIWVLAEEFTRLKNRRIEHVVLDVKNRAAKLPQHLLGLQINAWLTSVRQGAAGRQFPFAMPIQAPVQFETFFVVGLPESTRRTGYPGIQTDVFSNDRERAIADSLKTAYAGISPEAALQDLNHPERGVRRVAVEANIDRLTEAQIQQVLTEARRQSDENLALITENLYRVPFSSIADTLEELARSENTDVSRAATSSLVRSVSPGAVAAVNRIWRESEMQPLLRHDIVNTILEAKDHRYAALLTQYAEQLLLRFTEADPTPVAEDGRPQDDETDPADNAGRPDDVSTVRRPAEAASASSPEARSLRNVLSFLSEQDIHDFSHVARDRLLQITDPVIQDVVVSHILKNPDFSDEQLMRGYIAQRLPPSAIGDGLDQEQLKKLTQRLGPRGESSGSRVTLELMNAIRQFPDSSWTEQLVELADSGAVNGSVRNEAFRVALACARHDQMDEIIDRFDSYDRLKRTHLLRQLSVMEHPRFLALARRCLDEDETTQNLALDTLHRNGSPEAILLIVERLRAIRTTAEHIEELDTRSFRLVSRIFSLLPSVSLPEASREVNLCQRSPVLNLSERATACIRSSYATFFRNTAIRDQIQEAFELRRSGEYAEAIRRYDFILEMEPFYASGYVSRASLKLRTGKPESAMRDLEMAGQLNPEDATILSITAINQVRLGNVDQGLAEAEKILAAVPDLKTTLRRDTLYNTACVYGRASELAASEADRERHTQRAMELLKDCVDREGGFDDPTHLVEDPDLNMFHEHPDWEGLVERVRANEAGKLQP